MISDPIQPKQHHSLIGPLFAFIVILVSLWFISWFFSLKDTPHFLQIVVKLLSYAIVLPCTLYSAFGTVSWVKSQVWQRHQRRRQQAEERGMLATKQPVPNAQALILPYTLEIGAGLGQYIWMLAIFGPLLLFIPIVTLIAFLTNTLSINLAFNELILSSFFVLTIGLVYWVLNKARYGVKVTQDGLYNDTKFQADMQCIKWEDARFFFMSGKGTGWSPLYYTLSSDAGRVRWIHLLPSSQRYLSIYRSLVPFDEYEKDAKAVLELIAGKTSLALYDIRKRHHA